MAKVIIEKEDIVKYFEDMKCKQCPFSDSCDKLTDEQNNSLCHYIINTED